MFVDEVDIHVAAGHGGAGALSFRREKFVPRGGPDGGDGGHGGSIYMVASANLNTLLNYRFQKIFEAGRGAHGEGSRRTGRSGADIELKVPIGTVVYARIPTEPAASADPGLCPDLVPPDDEASLPTRPCEASQASRPDMSSSPISRRLASA